MGGAVKISCFSLSNVVVKLISFQFWDKTVNFSTLASIHGWLATLLGTSDHCHAIQCHSCALISTFNYSNLIDSRRLKYVNRNCRPHGRATVPNKVASGCMPHSSRVMLCHTCLQEGTWTLP